MSLLLYSLYPVGCLAQSKCILSDSAANATLEEDFGRRFMEEKGWEKLGVA